MGSMEDEECGKCGVCGNALNLIDLLISKHCNAFIRHKNA